MRYLFACPAQINGQQVLSDRGLVVFTMRRRYEGRRDQICPSERMDEVRWERRLVQRQLRKARQRRKKRRGWA